MNPERPTISLHQKRCSRCGEVKSLNAFYKDSHCSDGVRSECKQCRKQDAARYREQHPEKERERRRNYQAKKHAEKLARDRLYRSINRDKILQYRRGYYQAHRAKALEQSRSYYQAHRQKELQRSLAYQKQYPDKVAARNERYLRAHPEVKRAKHVRRRAREYEAEGNFTSADIKQLYEAQSGCCAWCSTPLDGKYHVDHVIPLSRGGTDFPENLVLACARCNLSKQDKLPYDEWEPPRPLIAPEQK